MNLRTLEAYEVRKLGATSRFRLVCPCLEGFFSCVDSVLAASLDRQRSLVGR